RPACDSLRAPPRTAFALQLGQVNYRVTPIILVRRSFLEQLAVLHKKLRMGGARPRRVLARKIRLGDPLEQPARNSPRVTTRDARFPPVAYLILIPRENC